jgi:hypothetical protein
MGRTGHKKEDVMARVQRKATTRARKAARKTPVPAGQRAAALVREGWQAAVEALSTAETQVGRQVQAFMKQRQLTGKDASVALRDLRRRLEKERRKAARQLDARLGVIQTRVMREGQALGRSADAAVERALGALNIPSRKDIGRLTNKVEELSKKLDARRPARRR